MTDDRNNIPQMPDEDPVLDQHLASLRHFSPGSGFEDRVMAQVRIPAAVPVFVARRRRWPVLVGSLSGAAALSSTALTAWVALNAGAIGAWASTMLAAVVPPAWHAVLVWLASTTASVGSTLLASAITAAMPPMMWAFVIMNLAVPVSLLGLVYVLRPRTRMSSHAAR